MLQVAVDVGVVELDGGDEERVGVVVQELRTLVEERGIVLVALDDEPLAAADAEVPRKIAGRRRRS